MSVVPRASRRATKSDNTGRFEAVRARYAVARVQALSGSCSGAGTSHAGRFRWFSLAQPTTACCSSISKSESARAESRAASQLAQRIERAVRAGQKNSPARRPPTWPPLAVTACSGISADVLICFKLATALTIHQRQQPASGDPAACRDRIGHRPGGTFQTETRPGHAAQVMKQERGIGPDRNLTGNRAQRGQPISVGGKSVAEMVCLFFDERNWR